MSKVSKRSRVISALSVSLLLSLALAGGASANAAADQTPGSLTTPPPAEMSIMDIDPSYEYLSQASSSLSKSGTNTLQLTAYTYAYSSVDSIGAHFIIERWTGSAWVSAVSDNGISVNTSFYGDTKSFSLTPGYYYRGKTVHWVRKGSAYEEHTKYTSSYLL